MTTMQRYSMGFLVLLGSSACRTDETSIKAYNALPSVSIQSHTDGALVLDGLPETFYALASDSNHSADELQVAWFYGEDLICSWTAPDEGGGSVAKLPQTNKSFWSEWKFETQKMQAHSVRSRSLYSPLTHQK